MVDVGGDGEASACDSLANLLGIAALLGCDDAHRLGDHARTSEVDLSDEPPFDLADAVAHAREGMRPHWSDVMRTPFVGITHIRFAGRGERRPLSARPAAHGHASSPYSIDSHAQYTPRAA